jgi:hypothetical protein
MHTCTYTVSLTCPVDVALVQEAGAHTDLLRTKWYPARGLDVTSVQLLRQRLLSVRGYKSSSLIAVRHTWLGGALEEVLVPPSVFSHAHVTLVGTLLPFALALPGSPCVLYATLL